MYKRFPFLGFGSVIAAALAQQSVLDRMLFSNLRPLHHLRSKSSKRRRTGKRYPHCSARQEARYRRQIAAGQLSMDGCGRSA